MAASAQIVDQQRYTPGAMPLHNKQWEDFSHAVANGESLSEAARIANYAEGGAHNTGSRLPKQHPEIAARIAYLQAQKANDKFNARASKDWVVTQTLFVQRDARKKKDHQTNLACLQFLARLQGYLDGTGNGKRANSMMIDARTVNFFQVPTTQLRNALEAHLAEVPMAERAALLEAAPEIAEALNQAPAASVQDTFAGDSEQV